MLETLLKGEEVLLPTPGQKKACPSGEGAGLGAGRLQAAGKPKGQSRDDAPLPPAQPASLPSL